MPHQSLADILVDTGKFHRAVGEKCGQRFVAKRLWCLRKYTLCIKDGSS